VSKDQGLQHQRQHRLPAEYRQAYIIVDNPVNSTQSFVTKLYDIDKTIQQLNWATVQQRSRAMVPTAHDATVSVTYTQECVEYNTFTCL